MKTSKVDNTTSQKDVKVHQNIEEAPLGDAKKVIEKTIGEIRTFLDELTNSTSNYKSLHNLTEQVEHQYHGRFLIELIQNAHDALFDLEEQKADEETSEDKGRIEILVSDEPPFGALYVANDGFLFTESNFDKLTRFGQSDKDPEKHIGNKGIGFRSVLEITRKPEIFSRKEKTSTSFNGFNFRFNPGIIQSFEKPIQALLNGIDIPYLDLGYPVPLVDWGSGKLHAFRDRCLGLGFEWVTSELRFLSPYLLPEPINNQDKTPWVRQFEEKGFATVIRLPFTTEKTKDLTLEKVEELSENTILFLNKAKSLWIETPRTKRFITRKNHPLPDLGDAQQIDIDVLVDEIDATDTKRYWLWKWMIGGKENPEEAEEIREAVFSLPGKWPKVRKAEVALAIRLGENPEKGLISIFLPTEQSSGVACHLNAPFYGDIRRTEVDFAKPFNKLMIEKMAKRAAHIVSKHLAGKGLDEARAILDILVPISSQEANGKDWFSLIEKEFSLLGLDIIKEPLLQTSDAWKSVKQASIPPRLDEPKVFTEELFYKSATFDVINEGLNSRFSQIKNLFDSVGIETDPLDDWVASTVEIVAQKIVLENKVDWNDFWHDVMQLFPGKSECLEGKKVLLGTDGELHVSSDSMSVFFRPRSSGDDEEVLPDRAVDEIPQDLGSRIAFLHEAITVHVPREGGGIKNHPLHGYLSSSLVQPFGVESILRNVLIPAIPDLPIPLDGEKDGLCHAISSWGFRLVAGLVAKDKGEKTLQYLGRLPVPCHGGWYPLNETSFGPGWDHTVGQELKFYLDAANTTETKEATKRLLLPPDNGQWKKNVSTDRGLLEKAGSFDGIRLLKVEPEDWESTFWVSRGNGIRLPDDPPPGFEKNIWENYAAVVNNSLRPSFVSLYEYKVGNFFVIPGIDRYSASTQNIRNDFMDVLLQSIAKWKENWESIGISKIEGQSDYKSHKSPLRYWLEETPWLIDSSKKPPDFCPRDRWFIPPAAIEGRVHQFKHLNPVPPKISQVLDSDLDLSEELEKLGMPRYRPESKTSNTRLLDDLAISLENPEEIANRDIFMGQVRAAWSLFEPDKEGPFPPKLIVKSGSELKALAPSPDNPIFLPDETSSFHHGLENHVKNILAIESKDAKRLGMGFKWVFDRGIRFISDLKVQPLVDGEPWEETPRGDFFCEGELAWIIPVLMCCHAHAGNQARGSHTKAFSNAMDTIRKARLFWVDNLEVGIWKEDRYVPVTKIDAVWLAKSSTIIATHKAREKLSSLGEAFSSMMDRADLEMPLKLALSKLDDQEETAREITIEGALKELKIGLEHLAEIEQLWLGDLGWAIRLLRPLFLVLHPEADLSILTEITSENALKQFLSNFDLSPLNQSQSLSIVRESKGFIDLGLSLHENFGDTFQLDKWNLAMKRAGETPAKNYEATEQFQDHMDSAQVPLRSMVRKLLKENKEIGNYTDLIEQLESLEVPDNYQDLYWDVTFQQMMVVVKPLLVSWQAPLQGIESIASAQDVDELVTKLEVLNFEPTVDPLEIFTTNRASCLKTLQTIQKTGIIWCLRNVVSFSFWDRNATDLLEFIEASLEKEGYLEIWNDGKVYTISKSLPHDEEMKPFWDALDNSDNLSNFLISIDIKDEDLGSVEKEIEKIKNMAEKTKRVISVCGKDFDNTEDNLSQLFNHIEGEIHDDSLPDIDLTDIAILNEIKEKTKKRAGSSKKERRSKPKGRMSQAMKNLVGLTGEIHAYRVLRKKYGSSIVNPSNWISENSTFKFPGNSVSDDYGCDFRIKHNKKTYFIEVKATQGDEEVFNLGLSEIKRAVEVANRHKEKFIIFHITEALSYSPKFRFLPNPYDKKYSKLYQIFNAGLKIRYQKR